MSLVLLIQEGPRLGDQYRIIPGMVIGRSKGDVTLRDSKVSNPHAKIEQRPDGTLELVDHGSANGLWLNEDQVDRVELKPGVRVRMGGTILEVAHEAELELPESDRDTWRGRLWTFLRSGKIPEGGHSPQAQVFHTPILLDFTEGSMTGQTWILSYGPRSIGSSNCDLFVPDRSLPKKLLEIYSDRDAIFCRNLSQEAARLNEKGFSTEKLKDGDVLQFGSHRVFVRFL